MILLPPFRDLIKGILKNLAVQWVAESAGIPDPAPGMPSDVVHGLAQSNSACQFRAAFRTGHRQGHERACFDASTTDGTSALQHGPSTPIWYCIIKKAELSENGEHLKPVGSQIVGEVFIDLLRLTARPYLASERHWRTTLLSATPGEFRMTDLLTFAGVAPPLN